jgi:heme O synthase-like polyprenyltransferase
VRQATSPEGSLAQAIRLYKYSISYLTLLFAAVAVDSLLVGPLS